MAKTKISQYDATAANNTDIDSINIAEGMAPSNVNNAIRELMAHLKDMDAGTQALTSPQLTSADINGGTIDGATIGGASAGAGTFTNLTATGTTTLAGASTSADITFGDNDKAIFGAGSDLQIYHDSATGHSIITESGGGALQLRGENLILEHPTTGNNYLLGVDGASGYVKLYHNGVDKLSTSSTGISVTGGVTTDAYSYLNGLRISGADTGNTVYQQSGDLSISSASGAISLKPSGANILHATNTGVGIGASPSTRLTVGAGVSSEEIRVDAGAGWADLTLNSNSTNGGHIYFNDGSNAGEIFYYHASDYMAFNTAGAEAMRIDASGRVGIGITPAAVADNTGADSLQLGGTFLIHYDEDGPGTTTLGNNIYYNGTANKALFTGATSQYYQAGGTHVWRNSGSTSAGSTTTMSESMRIDSSGHAIIPAGVTLGTSAGVYNAANTLDDYEEGTWTPTIGIGTTTTNSFTGGSYSIQAGRYTKVGNMVTLWFHIRISNKGSQSGTVYMKGLPFTNHGDDTSSEGATVSINYWNSMANPVSLTGYVQNGRAQIILIDSDATTVTPSITNSDLTNSSTWYGVVTYRVT